MPCCSVVGIAEGRQVVDTDSGIAVTMRWTKKGRAGQKIEGKQSDSRACFVEPAARPECNKSTTLDTAKPSTTEFAWCWSQHQKKLLYSFATLPTSESLVKIISSFSFFSTTSGVRGGMRPVLHMLVMSDQ